MHVIHHVSTLAIAASVLISSTAFAQTSMTGAELRGADSPYTIRASDVIGATVVNADNVELGTVDDIVIVRSTGELHAIISSGGVLGIGDSLYAVRFDELKAGSTDERVFLDMSRSLFEKRPPFHYVKGESGGQQIWEKRLKLKKKIKEKHEDMQEERSDVLEKKRQIRVLESQLEELKRQ